MKTSSLQLPSLVGTLSIKSMLKSAPKHIIFIVKIQKFSGEGAQPPPQTPPPPHAPTPLGACGASIFAPSVLTHAPPTRNSGYGPERGICRHPVSVRASVTFVSCTKTNKDIFEIFSPSGSHNILVFPYQTGGRCSDGNPPNGGVECKRV